MTPGQSPDPFSPASAAPSAALGGSSGNTAPFGGSLDRMQELSMQAGATPNSGGKGGSGVRKVNNLPVYLVGVIIAMFIGIMVYVATQRADASRAEDEALKGSTQSSMDVANALSGNAPEGYAPASAPVSVATGLDRPPAPDGLDADAERIRQIKQRMFEEAVKAKLVVPGGAPRSAGRMPPGAGAQQGVQQTALNGGDSLGNTNPVQALLDQQGRMTNML